MQFLRTVVHRLTELLPNHSNIEKIFIKIISLKNIFLRYNEETKKLRNSSVISQHVRKINVRVISVNFS
jgi:hypothetical protein